MKEDKLPPPSSLATLMAWFPEPSPEPPADDSQIEDAGEFYFCILIHCMVFSPYPCAPIAF